MIKSILTIILVVLMASAASAELKSRAVQNYQQQDSINRQIKMELEASTTYLSLSNYFGHDSVALHGFSKMFEHSWKEETEHAEKFIDYSIKRGGRVVTPTISAPENDTKWEDMSACQIVNIALGLEMKVHDSLLKIHEEASRDPHLQDFIEAEYLTEQVDANKELADLLTRLERATYGQDCKGLGLHLVDQELLAKYSK